jgi:lysyl-tRNA synthetase, class II
MRLRSERWRRGPAAAATAVTGIVTIGGQLPEAVLSGHHAPSSIPLLPLHVLGVAGGVGLLVLALGLWHGKRRAAEVAIAALVLIACANLAYGISTTDAAVEAAAAGLILLNLGAFRRGSERSDPRILGGAAGLIAGAGLYALYAVLSLGAIRGSEMDRSIAAAGAALPGGSLLAGTPTHPGLLINGGIAVIVVVGWLVLRALLRPALPEDGHSAAEHARAAAIVRRHGADSLDPFTLREDKALFFEGDAFLAYRVLHETAVVSGDPVGPPGRAADLLAGFVRFAAERDWNVVITAASGRYLDACEGLGLRALEIGEEAVVDPAGFSLEGRRIRKVRQSVARVHRRGWRVEIVRDEEISAQLDRELAEVEADWRSRQPRLIGFAMTLGRLAGPADRGGGIYVLGRDPDGRLRSFLRFATYRAGLSLDLMRRAADEPNGLTEAMVVAAIEHARERGLQSVSLNFAGFAHVMAADAALNRSQRALRMLLRLFHGRFQLERLVRFNAKFFPTWQPRYLIYAGIAHLPLSALRVLQAEAYLPGPRTARGRGLASAPGWFRLATASAAIGLALTATTLLLPSRAAHAGPLHVSAKAGTDGWSFVYRGSRGRTTESSLFLPKGRRVILRIVARAHRAGPAVPVGPRPESVIRIDPLHRGVVHVPVGHREIAARVLGPKRFRSELHSGVHAAPSVAELHSAVHARNRVAGRRA